MIKKIFYMFDRKAKEQTIVLLVLMVIGSVFEAFSISLILLFIGIVNNSSEITSMKWLNKIYGLLGSYDHRNFIIISIFYLALLMFVLFWIMGFGGFYFVEGIFGKSQGLMSFRSAYFAVLMSLLSIPLSYLIFFLTIGKIYKKFQADFNFKHPVLYTSIVLFILCDCAQAILRDFHQNHVFNSFFQHEQD